MEDLDTNGLWWLPEVPDDTMVGRLRFTAREGASLELIGCFEPPRLVDDGRPTQIRHLMGELESPLIVHGVAVGGERITLYRVVQTGSQSGSGPTVSRFAPTFVLTGAHVTLVDLSAVRSISASFSDLFEWTGVSLFTQSVTQSDEVGLRPELSMRLEAHPPAAAKLHRVELPFGSVEIDAGVSFSFGTQARMEQVQRTSLKATLTHAMRLEDALSNIVSHLQHLVSLGTGERVVLEALAITCTGDDGTDDSQSADVAVEHSLPSMSVAASPREVGLEVRYRGRSTHLTEKQRPVRAREMVFRIPQITEEWPAILTRYFASIEQLGPVYDLYFATVYGANGYLQNRFLNIAQAIESFHRRKHQGALLPKAEWRALKAGIEGSMQSFADRIPPETLETFTSRLQFFNEVTLRERLIGVFPDEDDGLQRLTGGTAAFRKDIRHTRNYLTHYPVGEKRKAVDGIALLRLTMRMQAALCRLFLREIGIPAEFVQTWTKRQARRVEAVRSVWDAGE